MLSGDGLTLVGVAEVAEPSKDGGIIAPRPAPRIVGGQVSEPGTWPWMASLQLPFGHFCGGSLVAPDAIVTAAHCVEGTNSSDVQVVLGRTDLGTNDGEVHTVSEIIIHPEYDPFLNDSDVAVLLLNSASSLATVPLLTQDRVMLAEAGRTATIVGWGDLREGGFAPDELHEVTVPIVSNEVANQPEAYAGDITPRMLAAGLAAGGKDSCQGDSGGPLMVHNEIGESYLAGIVSWGDGCARPNKYGIYTRVSSFASWIDDKIRLDSAGIFNFQQPRYAAGDTAFLLLKDADLANQGTVQVSISTGAGDSELVTMTETVAGRFTGHIEIQDHAPTVDNGILEVEGGGSIVASYVDDDRGDGTSQVVTDTARIVQDDHGNNSAAATDLNTPGTIEGEIELDGDGDWFRVQVVPDVGYQFDVHLNGSLNDSELELFDSDGKTLLNHDDDGGPGFASSLTYRPSEAKAVYLRVSGYGSKVGTYTLESTEFTPGDDDHGSSPDDATPIALSEVVKGNIEISGDLDWFAFETAANERYVIQTRLQTLRDSTMRLLDPSGMHELAFNDDDDVSLASQIIWTAPQDGVYLIEVAGYQSNTGIYSLSVEHVETLVDDHGDVQSNATSIVVPSTTAGNLHIEGDTDWFEFTAELHTVYQFETNLLSLGDSTLRLTDASGNQLAYNDDNPDDFGLASKIMWQAPSAGTYYLEVAGFSERHTGTYELIATSNTAAADDHGDTPETATAITSADPVEGQLAGTRDLDWFRFDAFAGVSYVVRTELDTLPDSVLRVYAPDGISELAYNDDYGNGFASQVRFEPAETGTHYIRIDGYSGSVGSYRLIVESPAGDSNGDGVFDSSDLVLVFQQGRFEVVDEQDTSWQDGDWNGDGRFNSSDIVLAFEQGRYQSGPSTTIAREGRRVESLMAAAVDRVWETRSFQGLKAVFGGSGERLEVR